MEMTAIQIRSFIAMAREESRWSWIRDALEFPACPSDVLDHYANLDTTLVSLSPTWQIELLRVPAIRSARMNPNLSLNTITRYVNLLFVDKSNIDDINIMSILGNPSIPKEMLERLWDMANDLANDPNPFANGLRKRGLISEALWNHPNVPVGVLKFEADYGNSTRRVIRIASVPLPVSLITKLLGYPEWEIQVRLINNESVPIEFLYRFLDTPDDVYLHPRILQSLVRRLPAGAEKQRAITMLVKRNPGKESRGLIARHTSDPEVANGLCLDRLEKVRRSAMNNPVTPEEGLVAAVLLGSQLASSSI